jgi:hypothetical protein
MGNESKHVDKEAVFTNYQPITSKVFFVSLLVEFLGVCFFQFLGGTQAADTLVTTNTNHASHHASHLRFG